MLVVPDRTRFAALVERGPDLNLHRVRSGEVLQRSDPAWVDGNYASGHSSAALDRWWQLQEEHGDLTAMEEALVSRVSACTSVMQLPAGGQLGYKGSVINFVNDLGTVARQLPRSPKDVDLVVYVFKGTRLTTSGASKETSRLLKVRRRAVTEYLEFFCQYHRYYMEGIRNPNGSVGAPNEFLVPPFRLSDVNREALHSLPADGIPDGVRIVELDEDPCCEREHGEAQGDDAAAQPADGGTEGTEVLPKPLGLAVTSSTIKLWLRASSRQRPILVWTKRFLAGRTTPLSAEFDADLDSIFCLLHDVDSTRTRKDTITLTRLGERLTELGCPSADVVGLLRLELLAVVAEQPLSYDSTGCPHVGSTPGGFDAKEDLAATLDAQVNWDENGTTQAPFSVPQPNGDALCEYKAHGYTTLAFPLLFPFGTGDFTEKREKNISWEQWSQHLMHFHDARFARHPRFVYFMFNTHERRIAHEQARLYVRETEGDEQWTVGRLRELCAQDKNTIANAIGRYGDRLRNSPAFFEAKRKELFAMCEQLGDPSVFATNSHADTFCPYLADFIVAYAHLEDSPLDPRAEGLTEGQRHQRRLELVKLYPALVAQFFHLKTELYLEHVCKGILNVRAYWLRYEWQSRGTTHAHYFLWLEDAPALGFLDDWVRQEARRLYGADDVTLSREQVDGLVEALNTRALECVPGATRELHQRDYSRLIFAQQLWRCRLRVWRAKRALRAVTLAQHKH